MVALPEIISLVEETGVVVSLDVEAVRVSPSENVTVKFVVVPLADPPVTVIFELEVPNSDEGLIVPVALVHVKLLKLPVQVPLNEYEIGVVVCAPAVAARAISAAKHIIPFMFFLLWKSIR